MIDAMRYFTNLASSARLFVFVQFCVHSVCLCCECFNTEVNCPLRKFCF